MIPCLNEARSIGALVSQVITQLPSVIVVDDGSTDGTGDRAALAGAFVLRHLSPLGKGRALAAGWEESRRQGFVWALSLDGDGQHSPSDIPAFFQVAESHRSHLVIGDRMGNASRMPWIRRTANRWMSRRLSWLAGQTFPDSQCGFRLVHLPTLAQIPITASHFEIESDLLIQFARAGEPIAFTPIQVIYADERSKIHPLHDTLRWWQWWRTARSKRNVTGERTPRLKSAPLTRST